LLKVSYMLVRPNRVDSNSFWTDFSMVLLHTLMMLANLFLSAIVIMQDFQCRVPESQIPSARAELIAAARVVTIAAVIMFNEIDRGW
jgi:hypothetical protein